MTTKPMTSEVGEVGGNRFPTLWWWWPNLSTSQVWVGIGWAELVFVKPEYVLLKYSKPKSGL